MNTSNKTRAVALVASFLITLGTLFALAGYAYPEAEAVVLASVAH